MKNERIVMKKQWKVFWFCSFLVVSVVLKTIITYGYFKGSTYHLTVNFYTLLEKIAYSFDAFITLTLLKSSVKKIKRAISKISVMVGLLIGYFAELLIFNYSWQSLYWNSRFDWKEPLYTPINMLIWGVERYLKYGYPNYHWLVIGMIVACIAILKKQDKESLC